MGIELLTQYCFDCSLRERPCAGPCACLAEPDKPVDIMDRAHSGYCPKGFFDRPPEPKPKPSPKPFIPPEPLAYKDWPLPVRIFSKLKQPGETGIGDTVKAQLSIGGKDVVGWLLDMARIECSCAERQRWLNARFPYATASE